MKGSKALWGLIAFVVAATAVIVGRKGWRILTGPREPALGTSAGRQDLLAASAPPAAPPSPPAQPTAIAEDEESALRVGETQPETAAELADLLPEPDLPLAGLTGDPSAPAAETEATAVAVTGERLAQGEAPAEESGVDTVLEVLAAQEDAREPTEVRSRFGPHASPPDEGGDCPPDHPIKGNTNSMIYHLPGQSSYGKTMAEVCFASAEAAQEAGFRPRKR